MIKIILEKFFKKRKESFNDMKNINTSVNDLIFSYSLKSEGKIKELQQLKIDIDKKGENLTLEEKIKKGIIEKSLEIMTEYVKTTSDRISKADNLEQNRKGFVEKRRQKRQQRQQAIDQSTLDEDK